MELLFVVGVILGRGQKKEAFQETKFYRIDMKINKKCVVSAYYNSNSGVNPLKINSTGTYNLLAIPQSPPM